MRRPKRAAGALASEADCGPPERARHGALMVRPTERAGQAGRRVKHECRLDWYLEKGSIVDRQHAAGLRFRRDWLLASVPRRTIASYGPRISGGGDFSETQLAARGRLAKAVGDLQAAWVGLLVDVCCEDQWASGRLPNLREALTALADFYGFPRLSEARGSRSRNDA